MDSATLVWLEGRKAGVNARVAASTLEREVERVRAVERVVAEARATEQLRKLEEERVARAFWRDAEAENGAGEGANLDENGEGWGGEENGDGDGSGEGDDAPGE